MAAKVPTQLESILTELDAQEEAIASQLEEVKQKAEAVRAVIELFDGAPAAESTPTAKKTTTTKARKTPGRKAATTKSTAAKSTATSSSSSSGSTTSSKGKRKKKDGRAASWQKYALPGVSKQPMPEAVRMILATQPDKDFKIAEVMSALFKDTMPKSQFLKARNRISNILSGGVRSGEWHKGERGSYRLNPAG